MADREHIEFPWRAEVGRDGVAAVHGLETDIVTGSALLVARTDAQALCGRGPLWREDQEEYAHLIVESVNGYEAVRGHRATIESALEILEDCLGATCDEGCACILHDLRALLNRLPGAVAS